MDVLVLRILTRKSVHGYGYENNRDLSVQMLLDLNRHKVMVSSYFGLDRISYMDDILDELGITKDLRIKKPSKFKGKKLNEMIGKAMMNVYDNKTEIQIMAASQKNKKSKRASSARAINRVNCSNSKFKLQSRNHGK